MRRRRCDGIRTPVLVESNPLTTLGVFYYVLIRTPVLVESNPLTTLGVFYYAFLFYVLCFQSRYLGFCVLVLFHSDYINT